MQLLTQRCFPFLAQQALPRKLAALTEACPRSDTYTSLQARALRNWQLQMASIHAQLPYLPEAWEEFKKRPARRQIDEATLLREQQGQHSKEFQPRNLWTGQVYRSLGSHEEKGPRRDKKERSKYRCMPEIDCGRTRGSEAHQRQFCWYFARGCCSQGQACVYLHKVPTAEDEQYHSKDLGADIFGREKRAEHEGYRKGAGTFERDNRTLYVNYEGAGSYDLPRIRALLEANFGAWGPIKSMYIKHITTIAFIKYEWRSSAEFAKEAMHKQGLIGSSQAEVLTVRWSNDDPNPVAIVKQKREFRDRFTEAVSASWDALPEEQKQARIMQLQLAAAIKRRQIISDYPDTDGQYTEYSNMLGSGEYPDTDGQYASQPGGAGGGGGGGITAKAALQAAMASGNWTRPPRPDEDPEGYEDPEVLEAHRQQAAAEAAERARSQAYYNEATKGGAGAGGASEGGAADGAASHQGSGSKQGPAAGAGNGAVQGHGEQLPAQGQVQRQQGVTEGGAQPAEEPGGGERGEGGGATGWEAYTAEEQAAWYAYYQQQQQQQHGSTTDGGTGWASGSSTGYGAGAGSTGYGAGTSSTPSGWHAMGSHLHPSVAFLSKPSAGLGGSQQGGSGSNKAGGGESAQQEREKQEAAGGLPGLLAGYGSEEDE